MACIEDRFIGESDDWLQVSLRSLTFSIKKDV